MANTPTQLFRGAASTTPGTVLYTNTGAPTQAVVGTAVVANTAAVAATFTLAAAGIEYASSVAIEANSTVVFDRLGLVLTGSQNLTGSASAATVNFLISGVVQS